MISFTPQFSVNLYCIQIGDQNDFYHLQLSENEHWSIQTDSPYISKSNNLLSEPCVSRKPNLFVKIFIEITCTGWLCRTADDKAQSFEVLYGTS